jgi:hypothetical protein
MRIRPKSVAVASAAGLALALAVAGTAGAAAPPSTPPHWGLLRDYCLDCHNTTDWAGGLNLDGLEAGDVPGDAAVWEKVIRKLRTGMMPPPGEPRPERARLEALSGELETRIDAAAAGLPQPGGKSLHRLNRTEYRNAVRDLLGYEPGAELTLPRDDSAEGFDNLADVLAISPTLIQAYVAAAQKISRAAVGDPRMVPMLTKVAGPDGATQEEHVEGLPLGSRGGLRFVHHFPLDAEYEFRIAAGGGFQFAGPEGAPPPQVYVSLDGEPLQVADPRKFRIRVGAGPHTVGVALVEQRRAAGVDELYARALPRRTSVESVTLSGPFDPTGAGDTPSRRQIFTCRPATSSDEARCARQILASLVSRGYRRPAQATDPDVDMLLAFYESGRAQGGFETGIQQAIARVLVDPQFLFRMEADRPEVPDGTAYRISDVELATRLSFFLWSSIPDEPLMQDASRGRLHRPEVLQRQVRRMLADPRSSALVDNFAGQWLGLRQLANTQPLDRAFDAGLREAMASETKQFFSHVKQGDRSVLELLDSDTTFLNERLARHYGIDGVRGSYIRRVALPEDSPRRGLLGKASILTVTSAGNRTSPVMRGAWVMESLLGAHVPQPPPGVETDLDQDPAAAAPKSVRERLELHRANPTCAACHQIMDPLGFALENFDLLGRWRTSEAGVPVNSRDTLVDGTVIDGVAQLRGVLLARPDAFVTGFSERLLTYALGRRLEHFDQVAVRRIVADARKDDFRFSSVVLAIVGSVPFQMKSRAPDGPG